MIAWLRTIFTIALITILTGALGIIAIVAALFHVKDRPGGVYDWVPRTWSKLIMRVAGIKVRVHGFENAGGGEPRIFVSNHMSLFDVPALSSILPRNRFVAKAELFKIPIFGGAIRAAGMIEIQRDNRKAAFGPYYVAAYEPGQGAVLKRNPNYAGGRPHHPDDRRQNQAAHHGAGVVVACRRLSASRLSTSARSRCRRVSRSVSSICMAAALGPAFRRRQTSRRACARSGRPV